MSRWRGALLGGGVWMLALSAAVWTGGAHPAAGEGGTMLSVSPASRNVALDADPFTIDIAVSNVQNLASYELTLTFDRNVLEYLGVLEKRFLQSTGRTQQCTTPGAAAAVNQDGALTMGCTTLGLIQNDSGTPGPTGSAALVTLGFKPRGLGTAQVNLVGLNGQRYTVRPCSGTCPPDGDDGVYGFTSVASVESCSGAGCPEGLDIPVAVQSGVIAVYDPSAPTPTGVPPTPTVVAAQPTPNVQATVRAVLGTPERRLTDATPVAGDAGNTSASGGGGSSGGGSEGGVAGSTTGGRTPGAAGTARDSTGAPIAGYGPGQQPDNPLPGRVAAVLALAGMAAIAAGAVSRRPDASKR
ncbi:MAG: hypothetical protein HY874_11760 [Chloroflexi bacterium]|nr:hypothetical protein [Chloroflexota bacterium]